MARDPQDYVGDTTGSQMPGLSGTAAAFQSGVNKRKQPQKQDQSSQKKQGGGLGGAIKKGVGVMFGKGKGGGAAAGGGGSTMAANQLTQGMPQTSFQAAMPGMDTAQPKMFKKGGRVRKTGLALVHKGEYVIPAGKARGMRKRAGGKQHTITKA